MNHRKSIIVFNIEEEASIIAKILVWPQGVEEVKYKVEWRVTDYVPQTLQTPEEPAEVEVDNCQLVSVDDYPITEKQASLVDLVVDRLYSDTDLETRIWEIHEKYIQNATECKI